MLNGFHRCRLLETSSHGTLYDTADDQANTVQGNIDETFHKAQGGRNIDFEAFEFAFNTSFNDEACVAERDFSNDNANLAQRHIDEKTL